MSGQPVKTKADEVKFLDEYMENLALEIELQSKNQEANRVYKSTGQLPPVSSIPDNRTVEDKLKDVQFLKQGIIKDVGKIISSDLAIALVNEIEKSRFNVDGSLLRFFAQRAPEFMREIEKKYKYGLSNYNDIVGTVKFIEKFYTESQDSLASIKDIAGRTSTSSDKLVDRGLIKLLENEIYKLQNIIITGRLPQVGINLNLIVNKLSRFYDVAPDADWGVKLKEFLLEYGRLANDPAQNALFQQYNNCKEWIEEYTGLLNATGIEKNFLIFMTSSVKKIRDSVLPQVEKLSKLTSLLARLERETDKISDPILQDLTRLKDLIYRFFNRVVQQQVQAPLANVANFVQRYEALLASFALALGFSVSELLKRYPDLMKLSVFKKADQTTQEAELKKAEDLASQNNVQFGPENLLSPREYDIKDYHPTIEGLPEGITPIRGTPELSQLRTFDIEEEPPIHIDPIIFYKGKKQALEKFKANKSPEEVAQIKMYQDEYDQKIAEETYKQQLLGGPVRTDWQPQGLLSPEMSFNPQLQDIYLGYQTPALGGYEIPGMLGHGIRKRGIRGGSIKPAFPQRIDHSAGMAPAHEFVPFGSYLINRRKIGEGIISLKTSKGSHIHGFPNQRISSRLTKVFQKIAGGSLPGFEDLSVLDDEEKAYLHKVAKKSNLLEKLSIPSPSKDQCEKDIHNFEVMKGEIMSGNDNKDLIKKFKLIILKLKHQGLLPKPQADDILTELATLGY